MADNDALITQFMDVTGVQRDRAEFFLQAANFQLDVALSSFYEESVDAPPAVASDSSDDEVLSGVKETADNKKRSYGNQNFATMSSVREPEKEGEERGQAFYAGGSEHSGLQVLGPPKKKNPIKDMVSEVFRQAQSGNLEQFESSHDGDLPSFRSFTGTGYRLGQSEDDSVAVASGSKGKNKQQEETVTVKVYRQGFTVDDGELRSYEDPNNREFFESITRNEIPAELRKQGKAMVHVNVENHLSDDFVKNTPKFKAFTGSGHTLGSPAPATVEEITTTALSTDPKAKNAENEAKASSNLNVNQDQPTTMLSIRLTDGSRLSARFNLSHTIQDIRNFIVASRPEYTGRNYILLTTFPNKELTNPDDTIQQAGLQNAAILQRLK
ncbi:unnamed protein product [Chironomus riparius]|uniref:NSFL1 cofactor p47 n=1 Tax=Chironomus riparius TaxID=315576 RepID=A0A9N9RMU0_9DIPT|nr:unnamed protein product [Chironomus riparius]